METRHPDFDLEEKYLEETVAEARSQLEQARETLETKRTEMREVKKGIFENVGQGVAGNLSDPDNFDAFVELSQGMALVTGIADDYEETKRRIGRLENTVRSPYFARVDFLFEGDGEPEEVYIGRNSLKTEKALKIYVYDWRSPIAGVFYRFMTGPAYYDAPAGRICGEVQKKRQYEIKDSRLCYFFDADISIEDEILRQMLSRNVSPGMKAIVETIQREQDILIRNMENDLLMIQGAAGSGKTSVALHRAAYLMYQGLNNRLAANNILILSPNTAFEEYIAGVLPELGEENVVSNVFEDIVRSVLKGRKTESCSAFLEKALWNTDEGRRRKRSMELKTSAAFLRALNRFVEEIPARWMEFKDLYFNGRRIVTKEKLIQQVLRNPERPLAARLRESALWVWEEISSERKIAGREMQNALFQELQGILEPDLYRLYRIFWSERTYVREALGRDSRDGGANTAKGDAVSYTEKEIEEIRAHTLAALEENRIDYDDAVVLVWLRLRLYGDQDYRHIRQVIIDEAQDYYPLQYAIFGLLFPDAKYTVLGDVNQTLAKQEDLSFYGQVREILGKENSSLVTLKKSFRCTNEILQFSLRFLGRDPEIASFNRSGDPVSVRAFDSRAEYLSGIEDEIRLCRERGMETIGLLCKNESGCDDLFEDLKSRVKLKQIRSGGAEELSGILLLPSYMAKGLEFDEVIVCDAGVENYMDEDDRKVLYVECTRALHRLSVFCEGEMTPLVIADSVG